MEALFGLIIVVACIAMAIACWPIVIVILLFVMMAGGDPASEEPTPEPDTTEERE